MAKGIVYTINHLAPFDVPSEFELVHFIRAEDSVHCHGKVSKTSDGIAYTSKEFGEQLDLIISRGAIRNADYIISLHKEDADILVVLHTTNKFFSVEDGEGMVYSEQ